MFATDILMVTYNRPQYTRLSLPRLLATCNQSMRVWVWHNGNDPETLEFVQSMRAHPCLYRLQHSLENVPLRVATNWFWSSATGELVGKVDDDCLVPDGWADTLRRAHGDVKRFGAIGCWGFFRPEDFDPVLAAHKIREFPAGHRLLQHPWVGGSSYLMKRRCIDVQGLLRFEESFPEYCMRLAWSGWINGLYYPLILVDHMDDPRSPHTLLRTDADMQRYAPLTAVKNHIVSVREWQKSIEDTARYVQSSRPEPCRLFWLRGWPYRLWGGVRRLRAEARSRRRKAQPAGGAGVPVHTHG